MFNFPAYLAQAFETVQNTLSDPSAMTPHGYCLLWDPGLIWLYAISGTTTGLAYFSIPAALIIFQRKRRDLVFASVLWLFVFFILLCGVTHFFNVLTLWIPAYGWEGVFKAATAVVSVTAAVVLWIALPKMLSLPSNEHLQKVNAALLEANLALKENEERQRIAFENSSIALFSLDSGGILRRVSKSWLELLGYGEDERDKVVGQPFEAYLAPGQSQWSVEKFNDLRSVEITPDIELHFRKKDGTTVETLVSTRVQLGRADNWLVGDVVNVTERRKAEAALKASEERLRQSQKLESIGHLTGGIAHDFNNMLQGIAGYLTLLDWSIEGDKDAAEKAAHIAGARRSLDRASNLTQRMLAFGRRQTLEPQSLDVNRLILDLRELVSRSIGPSIALHMSLNSGSQKVFCDANQLENALLNLAINARDAMPDGGKLKIATTLVNRDDVPVLKTISSPSESFIKISAEDNGTGMEPNVLSLVFEPFFTTKPIGQGTGLGLSQIQGFVQQSGGVVDIASTVGEGTIVSLYFPCINEVELAKNGAACEASNDSGVRLKEARETATILMIDDEPGVREPATEILRMLGYTVIEAANGIDGLKLINSVSNYDLIVTDVGLPGLNGRQLADAARETRPELPILFITGYAGSALEQIKTTPNMQILKKPFDLSSLSTKVGEMLLDSRTKKLITV